jgi:hypothetical protein
MWNRNSNCTSQYNAHPFSHAHIRKLLLITHNNKRWNGRMIKQQYIQLYNDGGNMQLKCIRRVWRYQRDNTNPYIEERQTTQWPKEKVQKDKQRSTKLTYKTKGRVTRTPLKIGYELRCSGRVRSSCSTRGTRRVNLVFNAFFSVLWDCKSSSYKMYFNT